MTCRQIPSVLVKTVLSASCRAVISSRAFWIRAASKCPFTLIASQMLYFAVPGSSCSIKSSPSWLKDRGATDASSRLVIINGVSGVGRVLPNRFSSSAFFEGERPSRRWANVSIIRLTMPFYRIYISVRVSVTPDFHKTRDDAANDLESVSRSSLLTLLVSGENLPHNDDRRRSLPQIESMKAVISMQIDS